MLRRRIKNQLYRGLSNSVVSNVFFCFLMSYTLHTSEPCHESTNFEPSYAEPVSSEQRRDNLNEDELLEVIAQLICPQCWSGWYHKPLSLVWHSTQLAEQANQTRGRSTCPISLQRTFTSLPASSDRERARLLSRRCGSRAQYPIHSTHSI